MVLKWTLQMRTAGRHLFWFLVRLLLEYGAEIDAADEDGLTALFWANVGGGRKTVNMKLIQGFIRRHPTCGWGQLRQH